MPPPSTTTLTPLPASAGRSGVEAADAATGISPSDCMVTNAAPNPPASPTRIRKSRLVKGRFCVTMLCHHLYMDFSITPLSANDWEAVRAIYLEGIATGH